MLIDIWILKGEESAVTKGVHFFLSIESFGIVRQKSFKNFIGIVMTNQGRVLCTH